MLQHLQTNSPRAFNNYEEYCQQELFQKIGYTAQDIQRIDLVFDVYPENILKCKTRENRVEEVSAICKNFQKFMRNDLNNKKQNYSKYFFKL